MIALGQERQSKVDWMLVAAVTGLMTIGLAFIYSATSVSETAQVIPLYKQRWFLQLVW